MRSLWLVVLAACAGRAHAPNGPLVDVPRPGRNFEAVIDSVAGARGDGYGVAYAGATSLENRYTLDGADIGDVASGAVGQTVPIEFLDSARVTTGGAGAESPGAFGGVVELETRRGNNELHGGVFGTLAPGGLEAAAKTAPHDPQTIEVTAQHAYDADFGADLAGTMIKDKLWFFVGFAAEYSRTDYVRRIEARTDCRALQSDGRLSLCDPARADGEADVDPRTGYHLVQEVARETRGASERAYPFVLRLDSALSYDHQDALTIVATPTVSEWPGLFGAITTGTRTRGLALDAIAHDDKKWRDARTELVTTLAWHHATREIDGLDPAGASTPQRDWLIPSFKDVAPYESPGAIAACTDPRSMIERCPLGSYAIGGIGFFDYDRQDRLTAQTVVTNRVSAMGYHELEAGGSLEAAYDNYAWAYSGGYRDDVIDPVIFRDRSVQLTPTGNQACTTTLGPGACNYVTDPEAAARLYSSFSSAAFVQDSWQVKPNLTIDAGVRYQHQHLTGVATFDELAPRLGIAYDPTREGDAKVFAHWGRYYEPVPVSVAAIVGSDEYLYSGAPIDPTGIAVAPGVRPPYLDELVAGAERALWHGSIMAAFHQRRLRRVLEDVSPNGFGPFTLTNPPGSRDYDALEISFAQHYQRLYVQGSYTLSRTSGTYDGLIDYENLQLQPNLTRAFDTAPFTGNPSVLPQDRTHDVKLDATYGIPAGQRSIAVIGLRLRAYSGAPQAALTYVDPAEPLIARSELPRMPAVAALDLHAGLRVALSRLTIGELFADVFNVFDVQPPIAVDNGYTPQVLPRQQPISGGSYSDLVWLRDSNDHLAQRNPNFHQPTAYYVPLSARVGFRLSF